MLAVSFRKSCSWFWHCPALRPLMLLAGGFMIQDCSHSSIVIRDLDHALRQDDAAMVVYLKDSSRIETAPYFHVLGATPDSLRVYSVHRERNGMLLHGEDIDAMTSAIRNQDTDQPKLRQNGDSLPGIRQPPLLFWGKGTMYGSDGHVREWCGTVRPSSVLKVVMEDDRYLSLERLQKKLVGRFRVTLTDTVFSADSVRVGKDSTDYVESDSRMRRRIPTEAIRTLSRQPGLLSQIGTALSGMFFGPLVFGMLPTLVLAAIQQPKGEAVMGLMIPLVYGGAAGLVLGPVIAHSSMFVTYVFPP